MVTEFTESLYKLEAWITNNGFAGYDPYDIRGQDWYIRFFGKQNWFFRKARAALSIAEKQMPPLWLRKVLKIKKEINAKGMGLMASAYLSLYRSTDEKAYLAKSETILEWLTANTSSGYPGISWGYPFHWNSRILIPRGTPSSVVTSVVGDAFIDHYQITHSKESIKAALNIADFFLKSLNRYVKSSDQICFSYTPLDNFKVHNANLFVAAFLARLWAETGNEEYKAFAHKAVLYTISEQNRDGSFFYWGSEAPTIIDHYHTGFVLRHIDTIRRNTGMDFLLEPLERGYEFYLENLFTKSNIPKHTPYKLYPINIHSCSEALICMSQLSHFEKDIDERLRSVANYTINTLQSPEGYFFAGIRNRRWREKKIKIVYMRWAQAWMFLALAKLKEKSNLSSGQIQNKNKSI